VEQNAKLTLTCHHAVVTGGSRGIGAAIAEKLSQLGASVSLISRNAEALAATASRIRENHGVRVAIEATDVTEEAAVRLAIARVTEVLGAPTILVNNAGVAVSSPFLKSDTAFWRTMLKTDLMAAVYCTQAVLPTMLESKRGRIINIASTAGLSGYAYLTAYCAAKHALIGLTRALAMETARTGVTVNAVCPGYTDTDMTSRSIKNIEEKTRRTREEAISSLVSRNPQGRLIQPVEVADAVAWLCGENAGSITGQSIVIAGGELL
jgi:NAD(P)-dependent dehydrogenase (short-subunit alcohol dehydrogenase family)